MADLHSQLRTAARVEGRADASFEAIVLPLMPSGLRLARAVLGDRSAAEDAVQEATLKAWRAFPSVRRPAEARAWYLAIVLNVCRSTRRRSWWKVLRVPGLDAPQHLSTESHVVERQCLRAALRELTPNDRAAIAMRYGLDMSVAEIARALNVSESAVKSRLHHAIHKLRRLYLEVKDD